VFDGWDYDGDGACDAGDTDDDNDGSPDDEDSADNNECVCHDLDGDTCDECEANCHVSDISDDGWDYDGDGACDAGDGDDDNDGAADDVDSDDNDENVCSDDDGDTCDDCSSGQYDTSNDGDDTDGDGICNDGDADPNGIIDLSFGEAGQMSIDINYSSTNPIGGYQFQVSGVTLTAAYDTFDLIDFNASNGMVIGFSMSGANLPAGDGTLIHLEFEAIDGGSEISLSGIQFGDDSGNAMTVNGPDAAAIPACDNYDLGTANPDNICDVYDDDDDEDQGGNDDIEQMNIMS
jgi:hypothetical protein